MNQKVLWGVGAVSIFNPLIMSCHMRERPCSPRAQTLISSSEGSRDGTFGHVTLSPDEAGERGIVLSVQEYHLC